jgi:hypothetical protein
LQQLQPGLMQHLRRQAAAGSGGQQQDLQSKQIAGYKNRFICDGLIIWFQRLLLLLPLLLSLPLHRTTRQQLQLQHQPYSST